MRRALKRIPLLTRLARLFRKSGTDPRQWLLDLLPRQSIGAEIGVHEGDFSAQVLRVVGPARLHLIDPWNYEPADTYEGSLYGGEVGQSQAQMDRRHEAVLKRFRREIAAGRVVIHRGYSDAVCPEFPDACLDWVYIDGNHLYEYVKKDLALYFPKLRPGGLLTGDDYGVAGWWEDGVRRAVDEFASAGKVEVVRIGDGQFILRKPLQQ